MSLNRKTFANISKYSDGGNAVDETLKERIAREKREAAARHKSMSDVTLDWFKNNPNPDWPKNFDKYQARTGATDLPSFSKRGNVFSVPGATSFNLDDLDKKGNPLYPETKIEGGYSVRNINGKWVVPNNDFNKDYAQPWQRRANSGDIVIKYERKVPEVGVPSVKKEYGGEVLNLTDDEIAEYKKGGYTVEEYADGGIHLGGGPEYDSRYGLLGKFGVENSFRGKRDRGTVHTLSGDVYGGKFGVGASGSYEFGSVQNNRLRNKNFLKTTLGVDPVRGGFLDLKGGADIPIIKNREMEFNVTPFAGLSGQTKGSQNAIKASDDAGSHLNLNYGLGLGFNRKFKNQSSFGIDASAWLQPALGKMTSEDSHEKEGMSFAPKGQVSAKFSFAPNNKYKKIKGIIARQEEDKRKERATSSIERGGRSTASFLELGGEVKELTDKEIQEYRDGGYIVEEY